MTEAAQRLTAARETRDAARGLFDARLGKVRGDLQARGVGGRIADKVGEEARDALDQALEVASESKGVIAGIVTALALWFLRHPIIAWAEDLIASGEEKDNADV